MSHNGIREYISVLEKKGMLRRITTEVDKDWQISCVCRWMYQALPESERFGMLFETVKGFNFPVAVALYASQDIYATALGTTREGIGSKWLNASKNPIKPKKVTSGPVQEIVKVKEDVNLLEIPIPVWTPKKDANPYITAGLIITKDLDTGIQNVGTYRCMIKSKNRIGVNIKPKKHIGIHYQKYEEKSVSMPIAIAIGADPAVCLTSVARVPQDVDELDVAGGLKGEPVETVKGKTVDLQVPAHAEFIIEGEVPSGIREKEGPFGEFTGYMGVEHPAPIIDVKCITHRKNPIYHAYISQMTPSESSVIQRLGNAGVLYKTLVHDLKESSVKDVYFTEMSGSYGTILIQMKPQYPGHSKKVAELAADQQYVKIVTVVDEDIDIRDPNQIDWAINYRVNPARDITILRKPNWAYLSMDPSTGGKQSLGSKVIIDSTNWDKNAFPEISLPKKEDMYKALECWKEFGLPPIKVPKKTKLFLEKYP